MKHEYFVHNPLNILKITADPTLCKNCYNRPEICFKRPKEEPDPKGILYPFHMAVVQAPESLSIADIIAATPHNDALSWFSRYLVQVNISAAHIGLHYCNAVSKTIDRLVLNFEQMLPGERPFQFVFYGQTWLNDKKRSLPNRANYHVDSQIPPRRQHHHRNSDHSIRLSSPTCFLTAGLRENSHLFHPPPLRPPSHP